MLDEHFAPFLKDETWRKWIGKDFHVHVKQAGRRKIAEDRSLVLAPSEYAPETCAHYEVPAGKVGAVIKSALASAKAKMSAQAG
jgi:hypothetical protein